MTTGEKLHLFPGLSNLDIQNHLWTGNKALSSPGGAGFILYDRQPIRDRPVGGVGDFHTVRGEINPSDIHPCLFPGCRSCVCMCGLTMILQWDPNVPA